MQSSQTAETVSLLLQGPDRSQTPADDAASGAALLFSADGTDSAVSRLTPVSIDSLRPGSRLAYSLYSSKGVLLLPQGAKVTYQVLSKLRKYYDIFEAQQDAPVESPALDTDTGADTLETPAIRRLDLFTDRGVPLLTGRVGRPPRRPRLPLEALRAEIERARDLYEASLDRGGELLIDVARGKQTSVAALRNLVGQFRDLLYVDASLLPAVLHVGDTPKEYLFQHGLNVALLSMNAAAERSLGPEDILEIGLGAFLQDVGMLCIPETLRLAPRSLTTDERLEVNRHPIYSVDMLERMRGIGEISKLIAYQSHERPDRSGYPRGRHRMFIHPFAQVVGVADAFAALSCRRPHRRGRTPYEAMEILLRETVKNRFDRGVVRTYLDCMSLFPVGSYVRLSDGSIARVLRANPGSHTRPVVLPLNPDGSETDIELDLARASQVRVIQALHTERDLPLTVSR